MTKQAPARIRVRRETLAAWSRVYTHIRQALADADGDHRTYGGEPSDGEVFHHMVAITHQAVGLGETVPFVAGGPYEAPPRDPADEPTIINDLQARIERLERAAFWRNLEENPPKDGVPILPSPEWLEEAREKFPDLYGPEAGDD